jgi:hypothetical protein
VKPLLDLRRLALLKDPKKRAYVEEFTPGYYHGSPARDIEEFGPGPRGAIFATQDPKFAESFVPGGKKGQTFGTGGTMYPLSIRKGKHFDPEDPANAPFLERYMEQYNANILPGQGRLLPNVFTGRNTWLSMENPKFMQALKDAGYDTFSVTEGGVKNIGVFDPKNIRGRFAEYDPAKKESGDFMKAEGGLAHLAAGGDAFQNLVKAYKLFRRKSDDPENLYPLFVNANKPVPMNEWVRAEVGPLSQAGKVKSKLGELAYRPGWHAGDLPLATHIGAKSQPGLRAPDLRPPEQVWAEVSMPADVDWQKIANERALRNKQGEIITRTAHITDEIPFGGHYRYKTSPNMEGNWLISGDMRVNRVLSPEEVMAINEATGMYDLPRFSPIKRKAEGGLAQMAKGGKTPAWQRKEGQNPEGGLNAKGRASYKAETGGTLKRPQPEGGARRDSFCARMKGMKKKLTSAKTANDPDSRINKSLRAWNC